MKERFIALGWLLLEHKCRYYVLNDSIIDDHSYDMLEKAYDKLAEELKLPKSASDMVGFDETRPACQSVMRKLGIYRFKRKRDRNGK